MFTMAASDLMMSLSSLLSGADTEKLKAQDCNQGSVRKHTKARGVWGHAPPGKFWKVRPLRWLLVASKTTNADKTSVKYHPRWHA